MPSLIVYQLSAAIQPIQLQQLRQKLHKMQDFRVCATDVAGLCMELPGNTVIYEDDIVAAQTVFEGVLQAESLLSSLEQVIYSKIAPEFAVKSVRICSDAKCGESAADGDAPEDFTSA
jgi:hypothetical protein